MANHFPCPNPACTYQFDADQLPAAAMVTCPICRTRFPYRAAAPVAQQKPQENAPSGEEPWDSQPSSASAPPREKTNRLVHMRPMPKSSKTQTALLLLGFTLVVLTVLLIIAFSMKKKWFSEEDSGENYVDQNFNFRFKKPFGKWKEDKIMQGPSGMNGFLYKASEPDAWMGIRCVMYDEGKRGPRPRELDAELLTTLNKNFVGVQKNSIKATISKQAVDGFEFSARMKEKDIEVWGEIYKFQYKGIGYIMANWAQQDKWDAVKPEFVALRDIFEFASIRDNWKEMSVAVTQYFPEGGDYQVEDSDGTWERAIPEPKEGDEKKAAPKRGSYVRNATDEDEKATMLFRCVHPEYVKKVKERIYPADMMVLVLETGDTVEDVKKYVHDQMKARENRDFTFDAYQKQPSGVSIPKSEAAIGTFKVTDPLDKTRKKYYAIAVMKIGGKTVAAVGWCKEDTCEFMEPYILNFISSLKPRK